MPWRLLSFSHFKVSSTFFPHGLSGLCQLVPGQADSLLDLGGRDFRKLFGKAKGDGLGTLEVQEGMAETDAAVPKFVDVILDVFRIGSNDGAVVMVVRIRELFPLVRNARIEDLLDALTDEPGHMTVSQLGRDSTRTHWGWTRCPARTFCGRRPV